MAKKNQLTEAEFASPQEENKRLRNKTHNFDCKNKRLMECKAANKAEP